MARVLLGLLLAAPLVRSSQPAWAGQLQPPPSAPCPPSSTPPTTDPPSSTIVVTILSVEPESDLEGDDDFVPGYDNHADIYGKVEIAGEAFDLPRIEGNDHPHWENGSGRFAKAVTAGPVPIAIRIREADDGITVDDDTVDIKPGGGTDLTFNVDLCALTVSGDVGGTMQQVFQVDGGGGNEDATIRFLVEMADGRPVSANDLALTEVDLIQVVPHADRFASNKPTIAMVRVANNFTQTIDTSLRLQIIGNNGIIRDDTFAVTLEPGQTRRLYFHRDQPFAFPWAPLPYQAVVIATIDPDRVHSGPIRRSSTCPA